MNGADLISIRDILGHSDIRMTARYAHSSEELKRRAVESLAEMMKQKQKDEQIFTNYSHIEPDQKDSLLSH